MQSVFGIKALLYSSLCNDYFQSLSLRFSVLERKLPDNPILAEQSYTIPFPSGYLSLSHSISPARRPGRRARVPDAQHRAVLRQLLAGHRAVGALRALVRHLRALLRAHTLRGRGVSAEEPTRKVQGQGENSFRSTPLTVAKPELYLKPTDLPSKQAIDGNMVYSSSRTVLVRPNRLNKKLRNEGKLTEMN